MPCSATAKVQIEPPHMAQHVEDPAIDRGEVGERVLRDYLYPMNFPKFPHDSN